MVLAAVGEAAYRIVQAAITNVLRPSAAGAAQILLTVGDGRAELRVHDRTLTLADTTGGGHGERAVGVVGRVSAGPDLDLGGWTVRVSLPGGGRVR